MTDQPIFYFDRIKILSGRERGALEGSLPIPWLKSNCDSVDVYPMPEQAQISGYKSVLDVIAPNPEFLRCLSENKSNFILPWWEDGADDPKVSYVEITRDTIRGSKNIAARDFQEKIKTLKMRWATRQKSFDAYKSGRVFEEGYKPKKGVIGEKACYYGSKKFEFAIYPRVSKVVGLPCVHEEWRIKGATTVGQKTNIQSIDQLHSFDLEPCFNRLYHRYMTHERIDEEKLGKWLMDWSRRRKFNAEEREQMAMQVGLFCRNYKIDSAAALAKYFQRQKKELKRKRGRKSYWDEMVLSVNPKKFLYTSRQPPDPPFRLRRL